MEPHVADFGLAKLLEDNDSHVTTIVAGTFGYLAPGKKTPHPLSKEGVVLTQVSRQSLQCLLGFFIHAVDFLRACSWNQITLIITSEGFLIWVFIQRTDFSRQGISIAAGGKLTRNCWLCGAEGHQNTCKVGELQRRGMYTAMVYCCWSCSVVNDQLILSS
jgi:hypothetical protein